MMKDIDEEVDEIESIERDLNRDRLEPQSSSCMTDR
jgi:hypothetical protein